MIFFIATIALFIWVAYTAMELRKATLAAGALLVLYTLIGDPSTIYISILWILFGLLVSLNIPEIRRNYITKRVLDIYKDLLPKISQTEQEAIDAGNVWWDAELFTGNPNWEVLRSNPKAELPADLASKVYDLVETTIKQNILTDQTDIMSSSTDQCDASAILERLHENYEFDSSIYSATLLSDLSEGVKVNLQPPPKKATKENLYRDFIEKLQLPSLITACLEKLSELSKDNVSRLSAAGLHGKSKLPEDQQRCKISEGKANAYHQLIALLDDKHFSQTINIHSELRKSNDSVNNLLNLALNSNMKLLLLTNACKKFYRLCASVRDDAAKTEGIPEFINLMEQECDKVILIKNKLNELHIQECRDKTKSSYGRKYPLTTNDSNQFWIRESIRRIQTHVDTIRTQIAHISAIIPAGTSKSKNAGNWAQKEWMLAVCVFMRDTTCLQEQSVKQKKAAIPEQLMTLLRASGFMDRLRHDSEAFIARQGSGETRLEQIIRRSSARFSSGFNEGEDLDAGNGEGNGEGDEAEHADDSQEGAEDRADHAAAADPHAQPAADDATRERRSVSFGQQPARRRRRGASSSAEDLQHFFISQFDSAGREQQQRTRCNEIARTLISKLDSALNDYSLWRANECGFGGKYLVGSHHHTHYMAAKQFVHEQRQALMSENLNDEDIRGVIEACQQFPLLPDQGYFAFLKPLFSNQERPVHNFRDKFLDSVASYEPHFGPE